MTYAYYFVYIHVLGFLVDSFGVQNMFYLFIGTWVVVFRSMVKKVKNSATGVWKLSRVLYN